MLHFNKEIILGSIIGLFIFILVLLFVLQKMITNNLSIPNQQKNRNSIPIKREGMINQNIPANINIKPNESPTPSPRPTIKIAWPTPSVTIPFSSFSEGK